MNVKESYDLWASQYDTNQNKTRDVEAFSLRDILAGQHFSNTLEVGCGTGKNTQWLQGISDKVLAIDLSEKMLAQAKSKVTAKHVTFLQADITKGSNFTNDRFDLVTFSLVLEHIHDLHAVFQHVNDLLNPGGKVYIGELHPFKQYKGSKARFETSVGTHVVSCFNHHITDYINAAISVGLKLELINEYFDNDDREAIPRILTLLLSKL